MTTAAPSGQAALEPVDTYLGAVLSAIRPLAARELSLAEADGAVLTSDVAAEWPLPPFDNSAMDGYAVLAAEVATASQDAPVTLPVRDAVPAGDTRAHRLVPGSCLRIMTGALLPAGADAIVPVEWTDGGTDQVAIRQPAAAGNAIKRAGDDAVPGDVLLPAGTRLGPAAIGLLAAAGHGTVLARPRPRITVISTGNELAEPGTPVVPGQIWESNSVMLAAAARQLGCPARRYPIVPDDTDALLAAIEDAMAAADLLVTSGGVSMGGEHDVVKAALRRLGTVRFTKVAMQPGMPQGFGVVGEHAIPLFTLPGNPVSAFVSFQLFVRPAVDALQDVEPKRLPGARAVLTAPVRSPAGKRSFLRGILDPESGTVRPVLGQASHQLASLAKANALIIVKERSTEMAEGEIADVLELP
ncbi:MAG: gephyrin-like molybdotransferase Glp [Streptosporangiaceae bacterium]|jgi:molybdopterin molybdotransferase